MVGLGKIIGQQRSEQRIDGAKQRELSRGFQDESEISDVQLRYDYGRQPGRDGANTRRIHAQLERDRGHSQ